MSLDDRDAQLLGFLDVQRRRVLELVEGLDEEQLRRPVLPSGWTVLGMIEHLGHAERHWFEGVATGRTTALPWSPAEWDPTASFTTAHPRDEVIAFYRDTVARADAMLESAAWDAAPLGRHGHGEQTQIRDLRFIVLHMIEETARHLGHLDAARELLDGAVGLGQDTL